MEQSTIEKPEVKIIGIPARTSFFKEIQESTASISSTVQRYFSEGVANKIPNRAQPGVTIAAYHDYESDAFGEYTFLFGEMVTSLDTIPEGMEGITVPAGKFTKFTTESGPMPEVVIDAWKHIWSLTEDELGGTRKYVADYEVYDERAKDPKNTILDIYIGLS